MGSASEPNRWGVGRAALAPCARRVADPTVDVRLLPALVRGGQRERRGDVVFGAGIWQVGVGVDGRGAAAAEVYRITSRAAACASAPGTER